MMQPTTYGIRRPPLRDIQFNEALEDSAQEYRAWQDIEKAGQADDIVHLHTASRYDFLDFDSFGAVIDGIQKVAGFVEHAFHYPPKTSLKSSDAWTIERLELVSLLKFDTPRVYVLDHLPRMDQLSGDKVPTRELDDFEADALKQISTEKDVVISHQGNEYRMLGSLRAANQCLQCHTARHGELLGAFSYSLHKNSPKISASP